MSILNGTRVVPSLHEEWSDYKVHYRLCALYPADGLLQVHFSSEFDLDIPCDMRRLDQYCATLYCTVLYCTVLQVLRHPRPQGQPLLRPQH